MMLTVLWPIDITIKGALVIAALILVPAIILGILWKKKSKKLQYSTPNAPSSSASSLSSLSPPPSTNDDVVLARYDVSQVIYVADYFQYRIAVFDLHSLALLGTIDGLSYPSSCVLLPAVDDQPCSLFVSEFVGNCISVFNAETGQAIRRFGNYGATNGTFSGPLTLALATNTKCEPMLLVGDENNYRIQVHNPLTGDYVRTIGNGRGSEDGQLGRIFGMAVANEKNWVLVSDDSNRVQIFDIESGEFVMVFARCVCYGIAMYTTVDSARTLVFLASSECVAVFDLDTRENAYSIGGAGNSRLYNTLGVAIYRSDNNADQPPLLIATNTISNEIAVYCALTGEFVHKGSNVLSCPKHLCCLAPNVEKCDYVLK